MFDETRKYKNNDHFFFRKGDDLAQVSKDVPELPGIYYIVRLSRGRIDVVYISTTDAKGKAGESKEQTLRDRINSQHDGMENQLFFDMKMELESIDGLDIYWFVTVDKKHNDQPMIVEGKLLKRHVEVYGRLPEWNQ